jgi:hypothetical protein
MQGVARTPYRSLAAVLVLAAGIRLYLIFTATLVSRDTVIFVRFSQHLAKAPLAAIRSNDQHPLHPTLVLIAHQVRRFLGAEDGPASWTLSAQTVACLGGLACILAMFFLARRLFNDRIAMIAAMFMALLPEACQYSADGLSDMPHLALYLFALAAAVRGFNQPSAGRLVLASLLSGLAYLARPEGLGVAAITTLALVRFPAVWSPKKRLSIAAGVVGAFLLSAGPYSAVTGKAIPKKSILKLLHVEESALAPLESPTLCGAGISPAPRSPSRASRSPSPCNASVPPAGLWLSDILAVQEPMPLVRVLPKLLEKWERSLRVTYLLLFIAAFLLPLERKPTSASGALLTAAAALQLLAVLSVATSFGYFSLRHMMIFAALCLPHAAAAADCLIGLLRRNVAFLSAPGRAAAVLMTVVVAPTLPWMLVPLSVDRDYYVQAIDLIRREYPPGTTVLTSRFRIPFFADLPYDIWYGCGDVTNLLQSVRPNTRLIILDEDADRGTNPQFFSQLQSAAVDSGILRLAHEIDSMPPAKPNRILVYEVLRRTPQR